MNEVTWKDKLKDAYEKGNIILLDRYTTSSLIYQSSLMDDYYEKKDFIDYVMDYEYNKLGIKISIYDSNGNRLNNDSLLGINFELDGKTYYPRVDGTTRINIADKVTDVLARIQINTENNKTWATGDYKIRIESFGSSDGIYYGLTASDMVELNIRVINQSFGLKVLTSDNDKIVK